jgi:GDP/UDP-N,N'-diacetylbacillosamine 2-epimerase (hydrolysing)
VLGRAITKMANTFQEINTDIVLVLGDRIEVFGAVTAAIASNLMLAHIHGVDVALGIQDDSYRHAITKLSHLHFAATPGAAKRIGKLGEESWRIFMTGSPSIDGLSGLIMGNFSTLNKYTGFDTRDDFLIVMQHPSGGAMAL